jgi:hypothetical protein
MYVPSFPHPSFYGRGRNPQVFLTPYFRVGFQTPSQFPHPYFLGVGQDNLDVFCAIFQGRLLVAVLQDARLVQDDARRH